MMNDKQRFLSDVIITAVEGGIGYWSYVRNYRHGCPKDGNDEARVPAHVELCDHDDGEVRRDATDAKWMPLDNKVVAKAFKAIMGQDEIPFASLNWRKRMVAAYWANDSGDIDSGDADMVVQIALFGKVVYG